MVKGQREPVGKIDCRREFQTGTANGKVGDATTDRRCRLINNDGGLGAEVGPWMSTVLLHWLLSTEHKRGRITINGCIKVNRDRFCLLKACCFGRESACDPDVWSICLGCPDFRIVGG